MVFSRFPRIGAAIASAVFLVGQSLAQSTNPPAMQPVPLSADQARALGVRFSPVQASANLEVGTHARVVFRPDAQYVVAAPYAGIVPRVIVAVGQTVRRGEALATFASPQLFEASRALTEANSQVNLAQKSLARDKLLFDDGIIANSRLQATEARATEATAMVKARRAELASAGIAFTGAGGEAQLVANRSGVVSEVNAVPGARVDAAAPLFRIVDPDAVELDLLVGRDIPVPSLGDTVDIKPRGATGKVIGIAPTGDGTAGVRVRASLERRGNLRAGENINVTLVLRGATDGSGAPGRVRIPAVALVYWQGVPGVFLATDKGFTFHRVEIDSTDDATAVVRTRLPAGARVAVTGIGALKGILTGDQ
ncbi:membrane fusion protein, heavy metal efflux system [Cupriavidus metallidurans]|jgi:RND family efflux transporter MFP subunit|uniref:efflux RND transporter periplasmic adaptor subunit n=1 Tax=Cupriavidus TaxID=106589 RepID=UPI000493417C|nr:efflux RND transporter periplasmic adaptor subunit [Cupriavidus metallidurans]AVA35249.1 efflux transporter periplasmic adaptor subunit [Cupriavidus metallidurans]KWW34412.1 Cobalt-zinc-cadmium resistance protein CzcB [Cupriavidus metallidurans]MDE4921148.1 efflux RND transporter periplasmic adaptor subunit [Cupriavidus metallidurans]